MTHLEQMVECSALLACEMAKHGFTTNRSLAMTSGIDDKQVGTYLRGTNLPSLQAWGKLRACMPGLPDELPGMRKARVYSYAVLNPMAGGNDITPDERNQVIAGLFGCKPQHLPCYDTLSIWVLDQLSVMPVQQRKHDRIRLLTKLFKQAVVACEVITEVSR